MAEEEAKNALAIKDDLDQEADELLKQVVAEKDAQKNRDLMNLFNLNQDKKNLIKMANQDKLYNLLMAEATKRVTLKADEITSKELLDLMKAVFDQLERTQKRIAGVNTDPTTFIQINNPTTIMSDTPEISEHDRESRDKIKAAAVAMMKLMAEANAQQNIVEAEVSEVEEEDGDDNDQH